jgi:hypothetical protein
VQRGVDVRSFSSEQHHAIDCASDGDQTGNGGGNREAHVQSAQCGCSLLNDGTRNGTLDSGRSHGRSTGAGNGRSSGGCGCCRHGSRSRRTTGRQRRQLDRRRGGRFGWQINANRFLFGLNLGGFRGLRRDRAARRWSCFVCHKKMFSQAKLELRCGTVKQLFQRKIGANIF